MTDVKAAIVTGAGRGIGGAVAARLLANEWQVTLAGRTIDALSQVAEAQPERALAVACDVRDPDAVSSLFAQHEARFGRLDLLFNNAGVSGQMAPFDELPWPVWRDVLSTNLEGAILCARAAFAAMRRQTPPGGRIINNGSVAAQVPRPGTGPYCVSKHAITGLTKAIALDGRAFNIACGQIDIGNVRTDMAAALEAGMPQPDGTIRSEPLFDLEQAVDAVLYMANLPLNANVPFMTVMATAMPLMGRG